MPKIRKSKPNPYLELVVANTDLDINPTDLKYECSSKVVWHVPGKSPRKASIRFHPNQFYLLADNRNQEIKVVNDLTYQCWVKFRTPELNAMRVLKTGTSGQMMLFKEWMLDGSESLAKVFKTVSQ